MVWHACNVRIVFGLAAAAVTMATAGGHAQPDSGGGGDANVHERSVETKTTYLGPLVCSAADCPTGEWGRPVNNTNFHLRDVMITWGGDGASYQHAATPLFCVFFFDMVQKKSM